MTFVHVDFITMNMDGKNHSPIILGRPLLRTIGALIDEKEGNMKFQFPHGSIFKEERESKEFPPWYVHLLKI
jgi:hypothetical protein